VRLWMKMLLVVQCNLGSVILRYSNIHRDLGVGDQ
jgi:hypothetical protein